MPRSNDTSSRQGPFREEDRRLGEGSSLTSPGETFYGLVEPPVQAMDGLTSELIEVRDDEVELVLGARERSVQGSLGNDDRDPDTGLAGSPSTGHGAVEILNR